MNGRHQDRPDGGNDPAGRPRPRVLLALWAAGLILFNFPMLIVWNRDVTVFGVPLLPVSLFAIWAVLIAALAWASEGDPRPPAAPPLQPDPPARR